MARSPLLAPSPSLFLSEEMAAGTAADTTTAFMYLLGEPVLGPERGREGGRDGEEGTNGVVESRRRPSFSSSPAAVCLVV